MLSNRDRGEFCKIMRRPHSAWWTGKVPLAEWFAEAYAWCARYSEIVSVVQYAIYDYDPTPPQAPPEPPVVTRDPAPPALPRVSPVLVPGDPGRDPGATVLESPSATATPEPTEVATSTPTATDEPTPTPTATPEETATPTPDPTEEPVPTPTPAPGGHSH